MFHPGLSKSEKKNFISIKPMAILRQSRSRLSDLKDLSKLERLPKDKLPRPHTEGGPDEEPAEPALKRGTVPSQSPPPSLD